MCGIAGTLRFERDLGSEELGQRVSVMARSLVHRGPDDSGVWVDPERRCALSHRRLSVLDLSARARQPMRSHDGRLVVTYNGEIYNFLELRPDVEKRVALRTRSDTEVLVELLRAEGAAALPRLDGMYAFAAFDTQSGELLLARDPFGEKPLYYSFDGRSLSFASELRALLALPGADPTPCFDAVAEYLALQYVDAPRTLYRGIHKLEPGHLLRVGPRGERRLERHFDFRPGTAPASGRGLDDLADELEEILVRSLRRRLVSDVPLGAFLSGGIDSSLACALVRRRLDLPLRTFTLGFEGSEQSEHEVARRIAAHLGTEHREERVAPRMAEELEAFGAEHDEPNGDASCWPVWRLSKLARRHVTVALSGDGGDELFGGYQRYLSLPAALARKPGPGLGAWYFGGTRLFLSEETIATLLGCVPGGLREVLAALRRELDWDAVDALSRMRASDVRHYLPGAVLAKVDRMSMRHALELRSPFLSREVAAFAERLPADMLVHEGQGKRLLRHLVARHLPVEVFAAPKRGFGAGMKGGWAGQGPADELRRCLARPESPLGRLLEPAGVAAFLEGAGPGRGPSVFALSALLTLEGHLRHQGVSVPHAEGAVPFGVASAPAALGPAQACAIRELAGAGQPVDVVARASAPDWLAALPAGSRLVSPLRVAAPAGREALRARWAEGEGEALRAPGPRVRILLDWPPSLGLPPGWLAALRDGDALWTPQGADFDRRFVGARELRGARLRRRLRPPLLAVLRGGARLLAAVLAPGADGSERSDLAHRALRAAVVRAFAPGRLGRVAIPLVFARPNRGHAAQARWTAQRQEGGDLSQRWHLYEDDRPLARPGAAKAEIRRLGAGRYRVGRPNVFYSASDATSPLDNGRLYSLQPRAGGLSARAQRWLRDPAPREWPRAAALHAEPGAGFEALAGRLADWLARDPVGASWPLPASGEPLRVALFTSSLGAGGAERQLTLLALEWMRRGATLEVVLNEVPNGRAAHFLGDLRAAGAAVHSAHPSVEVPVAWERLAALPPEAADWLAALPGEVGARVWRSALHLVRFRPHFVYAALDTANVCAGLAGALVGVPATFVSARSVNPSHFPFHRDWYRAGYRAALASPRVGLGANSRHGGDDYARWLEVDPAGVRVIHNGLDAAAFAAPDEAARQALRRELGLPPGAPVVLGVMRFTEEKRPLLFVDVMARVAATHPEAVGLLVGDGPMAEQVAERAAAHGLGERLRLLGARRDVKELLATAQLVLVTSAVEGHPNVPLEAQAQGTPIVATRAGGLPETVVEGETALLCPCDDAAALAAACAALLDDGARHARMAAAGRAHAEAHFRVGRLADETEAALRAIAARGAGTAT